MGERGNECTVKQEGYRTSDSEQYFLQQRVVKEGVSSSPATSTHTDMTGQEYYGRGGIVLFRIGLEEYTYTQLVGQDVSASSECMRRLYCNVVSAASTTTQRCNLPSGV